MGLDITFFKTKRSDFKNGEVGILDENGDNRYSDKEIYYLRNNRELRDYLQSLDEPNTWINQKVIELDYDTIKLDYKNNLLKNYFSLLPVSIVFNFLSELY